jgi:1,2-diacylglycerol 3-beta-glucosyltransferase
VLEVGLVLSTGYLLVLLIAARGSVRKSTKSPVVGAEGCRRLVILIPAHDEQDGICATLESLLACDYPPGRRRVVVVADNCSDETAARARQTGFEVWERADTVKQGKGFALMWALERLFASPDRFDAVIVFDADCFASQNMLTEIDAALRAGAEAVQVNYVVGNPGDSPASALRFAGFTLMNTVRPLGKRGLGLSCGLFGSGMAFTRELLREEPWTTTGFVEDFEYHLRLVDAGRRVEFLPNAWVRSAMPTSFAGGADQQARWEQGKLHVIRNWSLRLVLSGLVRRDPIRLHAGLEQLVPPQSLIAAGSVGSALIAPLVGSKRLLAYSLATLAAQSLFVVGGLRLVRAPGLVYRALLVAPVLIARKLGLYLRLLAGAGPSSWVRTEREPSSLGSQR